jgi:EmrB/QacA subfamily drug resistance transporter
MADNIKYNQGSYRWWVMATISMIMLMTNLDMSILYTSMPRLAEVFHVDSSLVGWTNIVYYIVSLSLTLTLAKVGDALGRKKVFLVGLTLYAAGLLCAAISTSLTQLIISRAIQGAGGAMAVALGTAITVAVFPPSERGKVVGTLMGIGSTGLVLGPMAGGVILDLFDWRAIFYLRVPVILACLISTWLVVKEQKSQKNRVFQFDGLGSFTLFGWLCCFLLYLSLSNKWGFLSIASMLLACGAICFFALFIFTENRCPEPIVRLKLFRNRLLTSAIVSSMAIAVGTSSVAFLVPFYIKEGLGLSGASIGLYMSLLAAPTLIFSHISGRLSDRIGSRILATFGVTVVCICIFLLSRLGDNPTGFTIGFEVALIGVGIGIFHPPNSSALIGAVDKDMLGVASAITLMARNIGTSISLAIAGTAYYLFESRHLIELEQTGADPLTIKKMASMSSFYDTLLVILPIVAVGIFTSFIRGSGKGVGRK